MLTQFVDPHSSFYKYKQNGNKNCANKDDQTVDERWPHIYRLDEMNMFSFSDLPKSVQVATSLCVAKSTGESKIFLPQCLG